VANIRDFEPILPDPQLYVEKALALYETAVRQKGGRIIFIEAELGGGKTELLGAIGKALHQARPAPNFIAGYFSRGEYRPYTLHWREPICLRRALIAAGGLGSLLGFFPIQYALAASLIGQAIETYVGAHELAAEFTKKPSKREEHADRLKRRLRRDAEERPTIVLLDDWEESQRGHWDSMLLSFAREVAFELPILVFVTVQSPINLNKPEKGGPSEVIKSLTEKGLAELWTLRKLSLEEVAAYVGPAAPGISEKLHAVTAGNASWVREAWREWRLNEIVVTNDGNRWLWNPQVKSSMSLYADIVEHRLKRILKDQAPLEIEQVREILACAALEGRKFTGEAVAVALNWNRNDLIDLLDDLLQSDENPDGILIEDGLVNIPMVNGEPRTLWLYRFVSDLHWFAIDRFGFADQQRPEHGDTEKLEKSAALIRGLTHVYQTKKRLVASSLARLFRAVGAEEAAEHYQKMSDYAVGHELMRERALSLLNIDKTNWEQWQCSRASRLLIEAGHSMESTFPLCETLSVFEEAADLARRAADPETEADAYNGSGYILLNEGAYEPARECGARALAIARKIGDRLIEMDSLLLLAGPDCCQGKYDRARQFTELCLAICKNTENRKMQMRSLLMLASINYGEDKYDNARECAELSLAASREIDSQVDVATSLRLLAQISCCEDRYGEAREDAARALAIFQKIGNRVGEATSMNVLVAIDYYEGKCDEARERAALSLTAFQEIGEKLGEANALHWLGRIDNVEGRYNEGRERAERSLAIYLKIGHHDGAAAALNLLREIHHEES
jgi:tetratricopeptide (TPR) repeat protein